MAAGGLEAPRLVVLRSRHSPHKLALLAVATIAGIALLAGSLPAPPDLAKHLPEPLLTYWNVCILLHGIAGLAAVALPNRLVGPGLALEFLAMVLGVWALGSAVVAALLEHGPFALFGPGLITAAWTVANVIRAWQIGRDLHQMRQREQAAS